MYFNSHRTTSISKLQIIEYFEWKWRSELSILKNDRFSEFGRKNNPKMFLYFIMDPLFVHRLEIRIPITSNQIKYRRTLENHLQSKLLLLFAVEYSDGTISFDETCIRDVYTRRVQGVQTF